MFDKSFDAIFKNVSHITMVDGPIRLLLILLLKYHILFVIFLNRTKLLSIPHAKASKHHVLVVDV